ncbi:MAG: prepilin peptidase [Candidatus Aenigmatarchaeota archaeon]
MIKINISPILIPISIACLFIVKQDIKERLVKNNYVFTILVFGILYKFMNGSLIQYPVEILSIFAFGAIFSFFLWSLSILPAGDSKLFTALLFYFPVGYYTNSLITDFLINIFVPIFVFVSIYLLVKSKKDLAIKSLKNSFSPYRLGMVFIILIGFAWFLYSPLRILGIDIGYLGFVILVFLGYEALLRIPNVKTELILIILAIVRILIDYENALTLDFYINSLIVVLIFVSLRFFVLQLSFNLFTKKVHINDLKPNMSPAEGIQKTGGQFVKKDLFSPSLVGYLMEKKEKFIHAIDFLEERDIKKLKDLVKEDKVDFDNLKVHEKQPFSALVFFGYFVTFILGTNFVNYLKLLFI